MNLGDPDLELVDPTPNVHALFIQFDKQFFWMKLSSRAVVRWSKRMYSCAGICSYEGRGGLCDIALSEPLLKLRPRKDLIETLLHEMIHAFLFVTCRDQDRDGHGPNFKEHMYRINKAAKLNISIYHDFHDEVKLYQTHWWRCNGPCQTKRPHFGIVRRTANRAPGPNDYWYEDHRRKCGGTFIKIKEPEKKDKRKSKAKPNADITKYVTKDKDVNSLRKPLTPLLKNGKSNSITKSNGCNTLVVTKKGATTPPAKPPPQPIFNGTGQKLSGTNKSRKSIDVAETVRNIWANKQLPTINGPKPGAKDNKRKNLGTNVTNTSKHKADTHIESPAKKIMKIDDYFNVASTLIKDLYGQDISIKKNAEDKKIIAFKTETNLVDCPICNKKVESQEINKHLDECLNKNELERICKDDVSLISNIDTKPIVKPKESNEFKVIQFPNESNSIDLTFTTKVKSEHSDRNFFSDTIVNSRKSNHFGIVKQENVDKTAHLKIKTEPGTSKDMGDSQKCACCGDFVDTSIEEHLEECLAFFDNNTTIPEEGASTSYANETIVIDDDDDIFDETMTLNATGTKSPCPCCLQMIEQAEMNTHLDFCLS